MSNVLVEEASLQAIADTIRSKLGVADTYLPSEMADAIDDIGGGVTPTGTKQISITENGTTTEDVTDYASAEITVNVSVGASGSSTPSSSERTATISIPFEPSGVFCYSDYDGFPTDNSWKMFAFAYIDPTSGGFRITRYGPSIAGANSARYGSFLISFSTGVGAALFLARFLAAVFFEDDFLLAAFLPVDFLGTAFLELDRFSVDDFVAIYSIFNFILI